MTLVRLTVNAVTMTGGKVNVVWKRSSMLYGLPSLPGVREISFFSNCNFEMYKNALKYNIFFSSNIGYPSFILAVLTGTYHIEI